MPGVQKETMNFPLTRQGVRNLDQVKRNVLPVSGGPVPQPARGVNVGDTERVLSSLGGATLVGLGLTQGGLAGLALALVGGALVYRGMAGKCHLYEALGVNTAGPTPAAEYAYVR